MNLFRIPLLFPLGVCLAVSAMAQPTPAASAEKKAIDPVPAAIPAPATPTFPLAAYSAIGSSFAQDTSLTDLGWSETQVDAFLDGMRAALHGRAIPSNEVARQLMSETGRRIQEIQTHQTKPAMSLEAQVELYMKQVRKEQKLQQLKSGLCYRLINPGGTGVRPRAQDTVLVSMGAIAADGTKLPQLEVQRLRLKVADMLPGLAEGIQMMTIDSQMIFLLPPSLSFKEGPWPEGVQRGMPILFFVALHEVVEAAPAP